MVARPYIRAHLRSLLASQYVDGQLPPDHFILNDPNFQVAQRACASLHAHAEITPEIVLGHPFIQNNLLGALLQSAYEKGAVPREIYVSLVQQAQQMRDTPTLPKTKPPGQQMSGSDVAGLPVYKVSGLPNVKIRKVTMDLLLEGHKKNNGELMDLVPIIGPRRIARELMRSQREIPEPKPLSGAELLELAKAAREKTADERAAYAKQWQARVQEIRDEAARSSNEPGA